MMETSTFAEAGNRIFNISAHAIAEAKMLSFIVRICQSVASGRPMQAGVG